jgi:hypothetical protein
MEKAIRQLAGLRYHRLREAHPPPAGNASLRRANILRGKTAGQDFKNYMLSTKRGADLLLPRLMSGQLLLGDVDAASKTLTDAGGASG